MKWRRFAVNALLVAGLVYLLLLAGLYVFQKRFIYPGWWAGTHAVKTDHAGYRDVELTTADGLRGRLLYRPPQPGKPVILFFHGNGDSVEGSMVSVEGLVAAGYGAVLPEYRGYNGNPGEPSEAGLYADARAAAAWMRGQGIGPDRTVVMGYSLGTGVAAAIALEIKPRALILVAPYASIAHVTTARLPFIPDFLVTERFDTASRIARIDCPILLIHGDRDGTIPPENSVLLKSLRPGAERILFPGVGHEVVFTAPAQQRIAAWLAAQRL